MNERTVLQLVLGLVCLCTNIAGTNARAILCLDPSRIVASYGSSVSVNCSSSVEYISMGWEAPLGRSKETGPKTVTWTVESLKEWNLEPFCYIVVEDSLQVKVPLSVTVYKIPDSVSISTVGHDGPMVEGGQYELQCDVQDVAPVQLLTVKWYKGETLVGKTTFTDSTLTPVDTSATLQISPSRDDDGAQYRCEAELDLGREGPQPPLTVMSDPLNITVHCSTARSISCLDPPRIVASYGSSVSVNCSTSVEYMIMDWEVPQGISEETGPKTVTWTVESLTEWDMEPFCYITLSNLTLVKAPLSVTIYKIPDNVSISTVGHTGPMVEGGQYKLQCDVQNVAPVQFLTVKWYKGETLVEKTTFTDSTLTPVDTSATLQIFPSRGDDGAQYRCEAELDLGPKGPQPPPTVASDPLSVTVHFWVSQVVFTPELFSGPRSTCSESLFSADQAGLRDSAHSLQWSVRGSAQLHSSPLIAPTSLDQMYERTVLQLVLGLVCLCTNIAGTNVSSILQLDPPRIVASYGSSVSANCSTNVEYMKIDWEAPQGGSNETGFKTVTWTVENLTEWDMEPFCYITVNNSHQVKAPLSVTIYKTPDSVSISTGGHTGPMVEGGQYELQCDVWKVAPVQFLTVKWYKGETLVRNTTFNDSTLTPENKSATLQISPSRTDQGAQYRCEAELDLGPEGPQPPPRVASDPLSITVHYGPNISCPLSQITVEQGEVLDPKCTAEGYPTPETMWLKEGEKVDFPQKMDRTDAGQYVFEAYGASHVNYTLEIQVLYAPFAIEELNNKTVAHGHNVVLKCSSAANPRPQYNWTSTTKELLKVKDEDGVSLLFIDYATESNTGTYTCTANNSLGEVSQSVRVDVGDTTDGAFISTVDHTGAMIEGREYKLQCNISYVAPVHKITVNWYRGGSPMSSKAFTYSTEGEKFRGSLTTTLPISHNRSENGTQYMCEAVLQPIATGSSNKKIKSDPHTVIVHYKPVINTRKLPSVVPMFRGYPEVLVCEAEGYPQPTITWTYKQDRTFEGGNLTITEATNENVGIYNCTASNSVDSTVRVVKVILKENPNIVSIRTVGHTGPMVEGRQYELQCDINVASDRILYVIWYKGETLVANESFINSTTTPAIQSSTLQISPKSDDNGAQYSCAAELELNRHMDGARPSYKVSSQILGLTVRDGKRTTFWAIVGPFIGLAVVMVLGYALKMKIG
ncbi:vascular cell adhesion protein 1-like [Salminus brasiliensis]|uniref:vascular cell adhesion protein 1-like n=1 Tax=Salminus brasiliensis TaxID=930266 RepID=UPI003B8371E4